MKEQIFVVEGKNDVTRIKQVFPDIFIVSVNGSAINKDILEMLIEKEDTHEIILCMDPDYPGEKIRKTISSKLKVSSHIFLERKRAFNKNKSKIGFEHLEVEDIKKAFKNIIVEKENTVSNITTSFLFEMKLIGNNDSKRYRKALSDKLKIGHVNGKTLLDRLKKFNISEDMIIEILKNE